MANFQKTLEALQPYVIGIRYIDGGIAVVDAIFKEGWTLPESDIIKRAKGADEMNYFMIFSEKENIGIDELLEYVALTIKANIDREKKHELLKEMVNELKIVFKKNTLANLRRLKFTFGEEEVMPEINEFDLEEDPKEATKPIEEELPIEIPTEESIPQHIERETEEPLTDEDIEILEEEARAANFFKLQKQQQQKAATNKISSKIELPPKKKIQDINTDTMVSDCECGPEEACSKCIGSKDY